MPFDPDRHHRRSIRLQGYDYSHAGAYFVTVRVRDHEPRLGEIAEDEMHLNALGEMVRACWFGLPGHYRHVELDEFVVMPNHVHGIILLVGNVLPSTTIRSDNKSDAAADFKPAHSKPPHDVGAGFKPAHSKPAHPKRHGLPEIVRAFKTFSARQINVACNTVGRPVWQRNYYEHVIRDEDEMNRIRQYILDNPAEWGTDRENPTSPKMEIEEPWMI